MTVYEYDSEHGEEYEKLPLPPRPKKQSDILVAEPKKKVKLKHRHRPRRGLKANTPVEIVVVLEDPPNLLTDTKSHVSVMPAVSVMAGSASSDDDPITPNMKQFNLKSRLRLKKSIDRLNAELLEYLQKQQTRIKEIEQQVKHPKPLSVVEVQQTQAEILICLKQLSYRLTAIEHILDQKPSLKKHEPPKPSASRSLVRVRLSDSLWHRVLDDVRAKAEAFEPHQAIAMVLVVLYVTNRTFTLVVLGTGAAVWGTVGYLSSIEASSMT